MANTNPLAATHATLQKAAAILGIRSALLDRMVEEGHVSAFCQQNGVLLIPWSEVRRIKEAGLRH